MASIRKAAPNNWLEVCKAIVEHRPFSFVPPPPKAPKPVFPQQLPLPY